MTHQQRRDRGVIVKQKFYIPRIQVYTNQIQAVGLFVQLVPPL